MRVVKIGLSVVIVIACLGLTQAYRYGKKISPSPPPGDLGSGGGGYGGSYGGGGGAVGGGGGPHGGFGSGGLPEYNDGGNFGGGGYGNHGHHRNGRHGFDCDDRGHAHGFQPQNRIGHETGLGAFDHDQGQRAIDFNERQRKVNIMFNILSKPREYEGGFNSGGGNHSTPNRQDSRIGVVSIVVGVSGGMGHGNRPGFIGIGGGSYSKSKGKDSGLGVVIMGGSHTPAGGQGSGLGTASMGGGVSGGDVGHGNRPSYAGIGGGSHTPAGGQGSGLGTASMGGGVSGGDVGHGNRPSYPGIGGGSHTPAGGQGSGLGTASMGGGVSGGDVGHGNPPSYAGIGGGSHTPSGGQDSGLGTASMGGGVSGSDLGYGGRPYNAGSVADKGQESISGVYDVGYSVSPSDVANEHVGVQNVEHESGINGINKTGIGNGVSVKEIFQDQPLVTHLKAIIEHIIHNARQDNEDEEVEHNNNYKDEVLTSHLKGVKQQIHSGYNQESQGSSLDFTKDGILYMQLKGIIDKAINRAVNSESHTNDIM